MTLDTDAQEHSTQYATHAGKRDIPMSAFPMGTSLAESHERFWLGKKTKTKLRAIMKMIGMISLTVIPTLFSAISHAETVGSMVIEIQNSEELGLAPNVNNFEIMTGDFTGDASADSWVLDPNTNEKIIPIALGKFFIFIPIKKKEEPEIRFTHPTKGSVYFTKEEFRRVIRYPAKDVGLDLTAIPSSARSSYPPPNYPKNPTLLVSIQGAIISLPGAAQAGHVECTASSDPSISPDPDPSCGFEWMTKSWERTVDKLDLAGESEVYTMLVTWGTNSSNKHQAKDIANEIQNFLKQRQHKWDIVLLGTSRGAVLAHDISKQVDKFKGYYHNLYTILIDPTASTGWGDIYPDQKVSAVKKGFQIDDGKPFVPFGVSSGFVTLDGHAIPGYEYVKLSANDCSKVLFPDSCSHMEIPKTYVGSPLFDQHMQYILDHKLVGSFATEILRPRNHKAQVVHVSAAYGHEISSIDGFISGGNAYGSMNLGVYSVNIGKIDAAIGKDGFSTGVGILWTSAAILLSPSQGVDVTYDDPVTRAAVGINDKDIVKAEVSVLGTVSADVSLTHGGEVKIGGIKAKW